MKYLFAIIIFCLFITSCGEGPDGYDTNNDHYFNDPDFEEISSKAAYYRYFDSAGHGYPPYFTFICRSDSEFKKITHSNKKLNFADYDWVYYQIQSQYTSVHGYNVFLNHKEKTINVCTYGYVQLYPNRTKSTDAGDFLIPKTPRDYKLKIW